MSKCAECSVPLAGSPLKKYCNTLCAGRHYRKNHRESYLRSQHKHYRLHPEAKKKSGKAYYAANREKVIARIEESRIKRRYGITQEQRAALLLAQDGACAICSRTDRLLCIDHCHKSGKVRALLCRQCNLILGAAADSTAVLDRAIAYLKGT